MGGGGGGRLGLVYHEISPPPWNGKFPRGGKFPVPQDLPPLENVPPGRYIPGMKCFRPIRSLVTLKFPAIDNIFHIFFCCQKSRGGPTPHGFLTRGGAVPPRPPPPPPWIRLCIQYSNLAFHLANVYTGELGYDGLNGTRKIGPSCAKSVVYI